MIPRSMTLLAAAAATCAALSLPAAATHPLPNKVIEVVMNGENVLDAAGNPGGDPDASGIARLEWDHASLLWQLTYQNLDGESVSGLHVHGRFGDFTRVPFIDLPLPATGLPLPGGTIGGVMTPADDAGLLTKLTYIFSTGGGETYLDLHTGGDGGFPGGAIAGALPEPGGMAALLGVAAPMLLRRRARR